MPGRQKWSPADGGKVTGGVSLMTTDEKTRVDELRAAGQGYKKIARELGLSENTVKSYIRRSTEPVMPDDTVCPECGKKIINTPGHRQRKFCSANCRCEYWKKHPEKINRRSGKQIRCRNCGEVFTDYERRGRKYCCHACYIADRYD